MLWTSRCPNCQSAKRSPSSSDKALPDLPRTFMHINHLACLQCSAKLGSRRVAICQTCGESRCVLPVDSRCRKFKCQMRSANAAIAHMHCAKQAHQSMKTSSQNGGSGLRDKTAVSSHVHFGFRRPLIDHRASSTHGPRADVDTSGVSLQFLHKAHRAGCSVRPDDLD